MSLVTRERIALRCEGCGAASREATTRYMLRSRAWTWSIEALDETASSVRAWCPACRGDRPQAFNVIELRIAAAFGTSGADPSGVSVTQEAVS